MTLVIDQLAELAERAPHAPLLRGRAGDEWRALSNSRAWALSGSVASWLIAQGFGLSGHTLSVPDRDGPQRVVLLLGALRAGALVEDGATRVEYGMLAACPVDAAVAERRLHIDESTPARRIGGTCRHHGDFKSIEEAVSP